MTIKWKFKNTKIILNCHTSYGNFFMTIMVVDLVFKLNTFKYKMMEYYQAFIRTFPVEIVNKILWFLKNLFLILLSMMIVTNTIIKHNRI